MRFWRVGRPRYNSDCAGAAHGWGKGDKGHACTDAAALSVYTGSMCATTLQRSWCPLTVTQVSLHCWAAV